MRSELVFTNLRCNQNCTYCTSRRSADDMAAIRPSAVRASIDRAIACGAQEVVLTGGEPAMRGDLVALVAYAREHGAERVALETNATLIDAARAAALREAGLALARVNLTGTGAQLDAITRDPGGYDATQVGLRALLAAQIPVEILAVVVRSTRDQLGGLPSLLATLVDAPGLLRGIEVRVPASSADAGELLTYQEAVPALLALEAAARAVGITVKIAPDQSIPPCVFPQILRVAHMFSLTPGAERRGDHRHLDSCALCQMKDSCSGVPLQYLDRLGTPVGMRPITEDQVRRRLSLLHSIEQQVERELVRPHRYVSRDTGEEIPEQLVRVNFHCNQACRFCFVPTHLPPAGDEAVRRAIVAAGRSGARVTLTGGEPTLNSNLVDYVRLAREHSRQVVGLQTNAIRLADPELPRALVDAGLGIVQVSLHGSEAELSDTITQAPGTFAKTVVGIDNLYGYASVYMIVNFVICQGNYMDLIPFVQLVACRWPRVFLTISFVAASSDVVPKEKALVPRYSDVLPQLFAAIAEAKRLHVDIGGFESMCGVPLCLVPIEERWFLMNDIPDGYDDGEFIKTEACSTCSLQRKCYGMRRRYYDLYGAEELRPIAGDVLAEGEETEAAPGSGRSVCDTPPEESTP